MKQHETSFKQRSSIWTFMLEWIARYRWRNVFHVGEMLYLRFWRLIFSAINDSAMFREKISGGKRWPSTIQLSRESVPPVLLCMEIWGIDFLSLSLSFRFPCAPVSQYVIARACAHRVYHKRLNKQMLKVRGKIAALAGKMTK